MAKRKNSMALFEVISKADKGRNRTVLSVPDWMRSGQEAAQKADGAPDSVDAADAVDAPQSPAMADAASPQQQDVRGEPIVSTTGGRLTVSLNYVSCTVALLAILFLVIAAFMMGRASMRPADPAAKPAGADVKKPVIASSGGFSPRGRVARTPGKYYLVIQEMKDMTPERKADAEAIVSYLGDYPATVVDGGGHWAVWSLEGFDSPDSAEAKRYAFMISNEGTKYGLYSLRERDSNDRPKFAQHVRSGQPE